MKDKIDWIELFYDDRQSMAAIMRENVITDANYGRSGTWVLREMEKIKEYEKETEDLLQKFLSAWNGQQLAYYHMKKVGAIA